MYVCMFKHTYTYTYINIKLVVVGFNIMPNIWIFSSGAGGALLFKQLTGWEMLPIYITLQLNIYTQCRLDLNIKFEEKILFSDFSLVLNWWFEVLQVLRSRCDVLKGNASELVIEREDDL